MRVYEPRIPVLYRFIVQPQPFQPALPDARQENVRFGQHVVEQLQLLRVLQIQSDAFLAAVRHVMYGILVLGIGNAAGPCKIAGGVSGRRLLDLYDPRALRAQICPGGRADPIGGQLDDEQPFKRFLHGGSSCLSRFHGSL